MVVFFYFKILRNNFYPVWNMSTSYLAKILEKTQKTQKTHQGLETTKPKELGIYSSPQITNDLKTWCKINTLPNVCFVYQAWRLTKDESKGMKESI